MLAAALTALPACAHSTSDGGKADASPSPEAPGSAAPPPAVPVTAHPSQPAASERPVASAVTAAATAAPTPTAAPTALPATPSPAPIGPRFVSVSATPSVVHDGDTVRWDVRTTSDVVAVSAHVATYGFALQRSGPGHFTLGFQIPKGVPFFFHRTYNLDVVARDRAGATANTTIALEFQ